MTTYLTNIIKNKIPEKLNVINKLYTHGRSVISIIKLFLSKEIL